MISLLCLAFCSSLGVCSTHTERRVCSRRRVYVGRSAQTRSVSVEFPEYHAAPFAHANVLSDTTITAYMHSTIGHMGHMALDGTFATDRTMT